MDLEVIDAFLDGETVDRDELKQALAEPEGRDYLVDLLDLRAATTEVADVDVRPTHPRRWRSLAAAAALLLCVGGGYLVGQRSVQVPPPVPGMAVAAPVGQRVVPAGVKAPAPTRTIRLEPNVNWTETPGGH